MLESTNKYEDITKAIEETLKIIDSLKTGGEE